MFDSTSVEGGMLYIFVLYVSNANLPWQNVPVSGSVVPSVNRALPKGRDPLSHSRTTSTLGPSM